MTVDSHESDKIERIIFLKRLIDVQSVLGARCYFVGGCVRDYLLGQVSYDYDLAVDGDLMQIIIALEETYAITPSIFGTAKVRFGAYQVDLATFRSERYVSNNGLPEIAAGDIGTDLSRRDFTINTGYILLSHENLDKMLRVDDAVSVEMAYAHPSFHEDIQNGILRVLHEHSFIEDPSRLLRAIKYTTLYHLKMDDTTQLLFNTAIKAHVIALYSKDRYRYIVISYARHEHGLEILINLYKQSLLIRLDASELATMTRVQAYYDLIAIDGSISQNSGILYLLLMYEYELDFWIGADRRISEIAKSCRYFQEIVAATTILQWQSRWWGCETFRHIDDSVLNFAKVAVSIPEAVKLALYTYCEDTQFIKLGINGNTLKSLGIESGKKIGELLNLLLAHKVENGLVMTQAQEIKWIESKKYEY